MQIFRFILLCLCLLGLTMTQQSLSHLQKQEKINIMSANAEQLPPSVTLMSTALGPLKGLLANAVMWRASELQDEKQFTEAAQLAGLMTSIQPHYPSVWRYQAFNLSFNIAGDFVKPEEKWPWILAGIELLRDKGLKYNPDDLGIRHELLRIVMDKIDSTDKNAQFMQNEWVRMMLPYFPGGGIKDLKQMASAPTSREILLQDEIVQKLQQTASSRNIDIFDFKKNPPIVNLNYAQFLLGSLPSKKQEADVLAAINKIYWHHLRLQAEQQLSFDIKRALWVEESYGPLDWRCHQTWAIYFGATEKYDDFRSGGIDHTPYITGALKSAFFNGRIIYNTRTETFARSYNIEMLPRMFVYYDGLYAAQPDNPRTKKSYSDFLEAAITICYNSNQLPAAEDLYYHYLQDGFGDERVSFEAFVMRSMQKSLQSQTPRDKRALIESIVELSYSRALAQDYGRSQGLLNRAQLIWKLHQQRYQGTSGILPEWKKITDSVRMRWLDKNKGTAAGDNKLLQESLDKAGNSGERVISPHPNGEIH